MRDAKFFIRCCWMTVLWAFFGKDELLHIHLGGDDSRVTVRLLAMPQEHNLACNYYYYVPIGIDAFRHRLTCIRIAHVAYARAFRFGMQLPVRYYRLGAKGSQPAHASIELPEQRVARWLRRGWLKCQHALRSRMP